ncbi:MAG: sigma-70 family RNA polymerase sigma factor, partial [Planctomycetota bacterium]
MDTLDDRSLLSSWFTRRDEAAFHTLCGRYAGLVAATCRRLEATDVDEASQAVFIVLAQRLDAARAHDRLAGWLVLTARHVVSRQRRTVARRYRHEQEAAMDHQRNQIEAGASTWDDVRPLLDEALANLSPGRREAVVRFYLAGTPQAKVAEELGCSVDAVKTRVHEGLDSLRKFFLRRGVTLSAAAIVSGLASEVAAAAPTLAVTCAQAGLAPASAPTAAAIAHDITSAATINVAVIAAALIAVAGTCLTAVLVVEKPHGAETPAVAPAITPGLPAEKLVAAKNAPNFTDIVTAEERANLLNLPPLTVYTATNAPSVPQLAELEQRDTISQYGITWTFDRPVPVGRFITGDWYVVGPVTIVTINPKPLFGNEISEGFIDRDTVLESQYPGKQARHGSMLNPRVMQDPATGITRCGFDSRSASNRYAPELFTPLPIAMQPGDALLSSISRSNHDITSFGGQSVDAIRTVAALTCVAQAQPADAFRPSYADAARSRMYRSRDLRRELLLHLPRMPGMPDHLNRNARIFQRPWVDLADFGFAAPLENMEHESQMLTNHVGEATLLLQMDYAPAEKERLLVNAIQVGIDFWGLARAGRSWEAYKASNQGRKWPIVFAGLLLGDADMQSPQRAIPMLRFQEDDQTALCPYTYRGQTYVSNWTGAKAFFTGSSLERDGGERGNWEYGAGPLDLIHPSAWP